ncbi:MAG: DUF488 family protein [Fimbriimonadaceae bacterium]|nr:DUF488 family protein [Fimbriimonadaceae bacterium]
MDRLAREALFAEELYRELSGKARVVSVSESLGEGFTGDLMQRILAAFADSEQAVIATRTKTGRRESVRVVRAPAFRFNNGRKGGIEFSTRPKRHFLLNLLRDLRDKKEGVVSRKLLKRMPNIQIKRVYDEASESDGKRILVDRLWPRGVSKERAKLDLWLKEVAPSDELRRWFSHDPMKWDEFQARYRDELKANPNAVDKLRKACASQKVTLLFGARDEEHNEAVVLRTFLQESA